MRRKRSGFGPQVCPRCHGYGQPDGCERCDRDLNCYGLTFPEYKAMIESNTARRTSLDRAFDRTLQSKVVDPDNALLVEEEEGVPAKFTRAALIILLMSGLSLVVYFIQ